MLTEFTNLITGQKELFCHCSLAEILTIYGGMLLVVILAAFMV
mgnify:CR=1 FL=1